LPVEQPGIALQPLRALPAGALEEHRAHGLEVAVERRAAKASRFLDRRQRMNDVVELPVLLQGASPEIGPGELVAVQAVEIALVQVDLGVARGDPVGERLADTAGMGDPHRLADPEALHLRRLAEQREAVRGEREHAVERLGDPGPADRRIELLERPLGRPEMLGRERQHRRRALGVLVLRDRLGLDRQRVVAVGPDAVALAVLADVERAVLVADQRVDDLARLALQLGQRLGLGVDVLHRLDRDRHAGHGPDQRAPDPRRAEHHLAADPAAARRDRSDPAVPHLDAADLGIADENHALVFGERGHGGARLDRPGDAVVRGVEGAEHPGRVEQRRELLGPGRRDQLAVDAEGAREPDLAVQVVPALGGIRELQAADRMEAGLALPFERPQELDRGRGEARQGARGQGREHAARGMGGRAAGAGQGARVQDDDVRPAESRQMIGGAAAGDAGTDDHQLCAVLHAPPSPPAVGRAAFY
jgi:hypothetical protein